MWEGTIQGCDYQEVERIVGQFEGSCNSTFLSGLFFSFSFFLDIFLHTSFPPYNKSILYVIKTSHDIILVVRLYYILLTVITSKYAVL